MNAIESVLEKAMREIGYTRFAKYIYRGLFSTEEVEHFVYFRRYGIRKRYLSGVFAARNRKADEFAIVEINKYGGELYRLMEYDTQYSCLMKFPLGILAGGQPRSSIDLEEWSPDELSSKLKNDVLSKLPPVVRPVTSLADLTFLLMRDSGPFNWVYGNAAMRLAQIIYLCKLLKLSDEGIAPLIEVHRPYIRAVLNNSDDRDFIAGVFDDADAFIATRSGL